ncbi:ABC transporter ATP-binding protein [Marinobacterium mangrovicola]|uniref:Putative ABC transport system ATP-binding protein n=1 Tax=Marinobacterium mangrovicola TaxID=1476959 RepID=A0A4R1GIE8_9GAMM|nr:ABC transporter ATP-binding protein [Marinobacterium mangrovicola]TCK05649.1 putative ABC transport system ATP-binding protein [Marinobacterium mangrovicola]
MIRLEQLCKTYHLGGESVHALDHMDLAIAAGDYLSVMGPSGSGKSTLLNMLGLLDTPDSGEYWLEEQQVSLLNEEQRAALRNQRIGFVFQAYHLIDRLNARENIELPLVLNGTPPKRRRPLIDELLQRLGLEKHALHLPHQLSGGQRQRVAIARAVIRKPALLLADEPTGNLDSHSSNEVIELLEELNGEGITLLVVTHDPKIGERAHRRLWMQDGRLTGENLDAKSREGRTGRKARKGSDDAQR